MNADPEAAALLVRCTLCGARPGAKCHNEMGDERPRVCVARLEASERRRPCAFCDANVREYQGRALTDSGIPERGADVAHVSLSIPIPAGTLAPDAPQEIVGGVDACAAHRWVVFGIRKGGRE